MTLSRISSIEPFDRGKRGIISVGNLDGKKVAIKRKRLESKAVGRIENEAQWLKILNEHGIGPRYIDFEDGALIYEFVEGEFILDWLGHASTDDIRRVVSDVLSQMRSLDKLGVTKEEMTHPPKHIVVRPDGKAVLLDFERCHKSIKPSNVTQFCQFILHSELLPKIGSVDQNGLSLTLREYKKDYSEQSFQNICRFLYLS